MNALKETLERLQSVLQTYFEKLKESQAFQNLKDRYDSLSPQGQRGVNIGAMVLGLLLLFSIPWSYYSESRTNVADFEDKRQLLRDMLKVYRESSEVPNIPIPPPAESVRSQIEDQLNRAGLVPEQKGGVEITQESSQLLQPNFISSTIKVSLKKLNLTQVVDLGRNFQGISPTVKLKDLVLDANTQDARYFDAIYKMVILAIQVHPKDTMDADEKPSMNKKKSKLKMDEENE